MTATTATATADLSSHQPRCANGSGRWTRARTSVGQWFTRTQLGPVDNYVTR